MSLLESQTIQAFHMLDRPQSGPSANRMPAERSETIVDDAERLGVLLVGHGTRDEAGTREFRQLGEVLQQRLSPIPVVACLLEFQQPTIRQAWDILIDQGVSKIRVAPLLLFAAGHAKQDIPDEIRRCLTETVAPNSPPASGILASGKERPGMPAIRTSQSAPLSRHPSLVRLLMQRITETTDRCGCTAADSALVMVGRGSRDPCASADMRILSELVRSRLGFPKVATAFYAMAQPRLPEVLDQVARSTAHSTVIVQPHLLFDGRLYQAIASQVAEANQRHPAVHFELSHYLGPDPLVAEAIATRVSQADF